MDQNRQKGFTLIELLIVVVILGILLAIAAPSMYKILEGRKLKGAAENLYADLMFAKTETIKRNNEVILSFGGTSPAWCYGIKEETSCDCTIANDCSIDGIEKVVTNEQYGDTTLIATFPGGPPEETGFEPLRGFSENSSGSFSNGTVTLTNDGREAVIIISTLGRVRICSDTGFGGYESC
jgi:type IV fimbrial biogenesis protein FimT